MTVPYCLVLKCSMAWWRKSGRADGARLAVEAGTLDWSRKIVCFKGYVLLTEKEKGRRLQVNQPPTLII